MLNYNLLQPDTNEQQNPFAIQIPIEEFERLEEVIENYGLSKLINEVSND